jgi:hypothetical protein
MKKRAYKKNKKNLTTWIIVAAVVVIILLAFAFLQKKDEPASPGTSKDEEKAAAPRNVIPGTNYTCEEIIPDTVYVLFPQGNATLHPGFDTSPYFNVLKNNKNIGGYGKYCTRQSEVGQNINSFVCSDSYVVTGIVSSEGIIERSYKVAFNINSNNNDCILRQRVLGGDIMGCKVVSSSCSWEYR